MSTRDSLRRQGWLIDDWFCVVFKMRRWFDQLLITTEDSLFGKQEQVEATVKVQVIIETIRTRSCR